MKDKVISFEMKFDNSQFIRAKIRGHRTPPKYESYTFLCTIQIMKDEDK